MGWSTISVEVGDKCEEMSGGLGDGVMGGGEMGEGENWECVDLQTGAEGVCKEGGRSFQ